MAQPVVVPLVCSTLVFIHFVLRPEYFIDYFCENRFHVGLWHPSRVYFPLKDSTLQYKKCVHLWNNFPCISTLQWMPLWIRNCHLLRGLLKIHLQLYNLGLITTISLFSRGLQFKPDKIQRDVAIYTVRIPTEGYHLC